MEFQYFVFPGFCETIQQGYFCLFSSHYLKEIAFRYPNKIRMAFNFGISLTRARCRQHRLKRTRHLSNPLVLLQSEQTGPYQTMNNTHHLISFHVMFFLFFIPQLSTRTTASHYRDFYPAYIRNISPVVWSIIVQVLNVEIVVLRFQSIIVDSLLMRLNNIHIKRYKNNAFLHLKNA